MEITVWINGAVYRFQVAGGMNLCQMLEKTEFARCQEVHAFDRDGQPLDPRTAMEKMSPEQRREIFILHRPQPAATVQGRRREAAPGNLAELLFPLFIVAVRRQPTENRRQVLQLIEERKAELAQELAGRIRWLKVDQQPYIIQRQVLFENIKAEFAACGIPPGAWTDEAVGLLFELIDHAFGIGQPEPATPS